MAEDEERYEDGLDDNERAERSFEDGNEDSEVGGLADIQSDEQAVKSTPKRRGTAWNDDQTNLLLDKWSEYRGFHEEVEKETNVVQNSSIYKSISKYLVDRGVDKTPEQCKTRIHTLKRSYKVCKAAMAVDINAKKMFRYYDKMDYILGFRSKNPDKKEISQQEVPPYLFRSSSEHTESETPRTIWGPETSLYNPLSQHTAIDARMFMTHSSTQEANGGAVCVKQEALDPDEDVSLSKKLKSDYSDSAESGADKSKENGCTYAQLQNVGAYHVAEQQSVSYTTLKNLGSYGALDASSSKIATPYSVENSTQYPHTDGAGHFVSYGKALPSKDDNANTYHAVDGDAIQRLKLDLEIKKIEIERKKLEIEERQRREEREHQYRMMQLILNGLGQGATAGSQPEHNTAETPEGFQTWRQQLSRHATAEQDVTLSDSQYL